MDKILLTAFLSVLAGFLTGILSIVKLVNEKESKTTDYRQAWTDSVRRALADLIARLNSQAVQIASAEKLRSVLNDLINEKNVKDQETHKRIIDFNQNSLEKMQAAIREMRKQIYEAYAATRLHFKPNDLSFNRIENKFDLAITTFDELYETNDAAKRTALKAKVHAITGEITDYARDILKTEWETVKRGEPAYQSTKRWSIIGSIILLFILLSIGVHAGISVWKHSILEDHTTEQPHKNEPSSVPVPQSANPPSPQPRDQPGEKK